MSQSQAFNLITRRQQHVPDFHRHPSSSEPSLCSGSFPLRIYNILPMSLNHVPQILTRVREDGAAATLISAKEDILGDLHHGCRRGMISDASDSEAREVERRAIQYEASRVLSRTIVIWTRARWWWNFQRYGRTTKVKNCPF